MTDLNDLDQDLLTSFLLSGFDLDGNDPFGQNKGNDVTEKKNIECFASHDGKSFFARQVVETYATLPPSIYKCQLGMSGEIYFNKQEIAHGIIIPDLSQQEVLNELNEFWTSYPTYKRLGFPHKRGVLLYGKPGAGKTTLIKLVVQDVIKRGGIAIELAHTGVLMNALDALRGPCPDLPIVITIEDLDRYIDAGAEEALLELLDGSYALNHIVFIASTNKDKDELPARLIRPSRFDCPKEIKLPNPQSRRNYLMGLMPKSDPVAIEALVKQSEGQSIAELKELVLQALIYKSQKPKSK